jgi:cytosine/adenosine deaminase-related metal-dependent hydrolase
LKLGSGIAPIAKLLEEGISVSLGADGAACNNRLDMFTEMRTAALLQKVLHGPEVLPAHRVLKMATIDGARALGLDAEIGSLEAGKRADLAIVRLDRLHTTPARDLVSALVYSAEADDVDAAIIDGRVVMENRKLLTLDEGETIAKAKAESENLIAAAVF